MRGHEIWSHGITESGIHNPQDLRDRSLAYRQILRSAHQQARNKKPREITFRKHYELLMKADSLIIDYFVPVINADRANSLSSDIDFLSQAGKKILLVAHGSDIRDIERHIDSHPRSPFRHLSTDARRALMAIRARNLESMKRIRDTADVHLLYTTEDLFLDAVEFANSSVTYLPLAVSPELFSITKRPSSNKPVVLQASINQITKQSLAVTEILTKLDLLGIITHRQVSGISHEAMLDLLRSVDIVVDQIEFESRGTLSIEAFASGIIAVDGNFLRQHFGPSYIEMEPHLALEDFLRTFSENPMRFDVIASEIRANCADQHDGKRSSQVIVDCLSKAMRF